MSPSDSNKKHKTEKKYNSKANSHIINKRRISFSKFCDPNYVMKLKNEVTSNISVVLNLF